MSCCAGMEGTWETVYVQYIRNPSYFVVQYEVDIATIEQLNSEINLRCDGTSPSAATEQQTPGEQSDTPAAAAAAAGCQGDNNNDERRRHRDNVGSTVEENSNVKSSNARSCQHQRVSSGTACSTCTAVYSGK